MIIALILCIVGLLFFAGMFLYACYHIYMLRHKINIAESHVLSVRTGKRYVHERNRNAYTAKSKS